MLIMSGRQTLSRGSHCTALPHPKEGLRVAEALPTRKRAKMQKRVVDDAPTHATFSPGRLAHTTPARF